MIQTVSINFRPDDESCIPLLHQLIGFLQGEGVRIMLPEYDIIRREDFYSLAVPHDEFVNSPDLIIVIGGDGTVLRTSRLFCGTGIPIFGINRGRLGFLTEFNPDEYPPYLKKVIAGDFTAVERLVLEAALFRDGGEVMSLCFLNDAVIHKGAISRPIRLEMKIDGDFLGTYQGDGLIISTPTGSTAYSLSAGGPIISPTESTIYIINPICPHSLAMRPMIVPASSAFSVRIISDFKNLLLTIDGQEVLNIEGNDEICIRQSNRNIRLITHPEKNYYAILREKLGWG